MFNKTFKTRYISTIIFISASVTSSSTMFNMPHIKSSNTVDSRYIQMYYACMNKKKTIEVPIEI